MSHHLYPHPLSFLLFLPFFFIAVNGQSNNSTYLNCRFDHCGSVSISYPFWKMDSESTSQFCGYEGFGINCFQDGGQNVSQIILGGESYYVHGIDYALKNIFLADYEVSQVARVPNNCPRVRHSVNIGTLPLELARYSVNLSFHFNCIGCPSFAHEIPCLVQTDGNTCLDVLNTTRDESVWDDYSCDQEVVTTVSKEFLDMFPNISMNYSNILERGFGLRWGQLEKCKECEDRGGRCGLLDATRFICFCSDGMTSRGNCKGTFMNHGFTIIYKF